MKILIALLLFILDKNKTEGVKNGACESTSCYPITGNLMIGRSQQLNASSTCGLNKEESYCIISQLDFRMKSKNSCFWCDSTPEGTLKNSKTSHKIENIVDDWEYLNALEPPNLVNVSKKTESWWQSQNGVEKVSIEINFEAVFQVTHLLIRFKSFLPRAMYIEKSMDWGKSWIICRYFADDCKRSFPNISRAKAINFTDVICTRRYSRITPSTQGVVIYRVIPPSINLNIKDLDPYSTEVQELLKTTNIRIHMTEMHTLGDENLSTFQRPHLKDKYFYAIYNMVIRGTCVCYGHAERCLPDPKLINPPELMVHGICDCSHNTAGNNCEFCLPGYNDAPWRPAIGRKKNECKKCGCHDHSEICVFNSTIYIASGSTSGGVCQNCLHNTTGRQCELCRNGYYQDTNLNLNDPFICKECDCFSDGTTNNGVCDAYTNKELKLKSGRCHCKKFVDGPRCDKCIVGYWNLSKSNPYGCLACNCNTLGTLNNDGCAPDTGLCTCKINVIGRDCNQCKPLHYGISSDEIGCKPCDCNIGGSYGPECDVINGQCICKPFLTGRRCNLVKDGYFTGALDYARYEAEFAIGSKLPPTVIHRRELEKKGAVINTTVESNKTRKSWTGTGFMKVYEGSTLSFQVPSLYRDMNYDLIIRYEHDHYFPETWENVQVNLTKHNSENISNKNYSITNQCLPINNAWKWIPQNLNLPKGKIHVAMPNSLCLEKGHHYSINLTFKNYNMSNTNPKSNILIDSIVLLPQTESIYFFYQKKNDTKLLQKYQDLKCREKFLSAIQPFASDLAKSECQDILYAISFFSFNGGFNKTCECDETGSKSTICNKYTGQCQCKKNIIGRQCDRCASGKYGFSSIGCKACNCNSLGSLDNFCRQSDGQCKCTKNAYGQQCDECQLGYWNFPNCKVCMCNGHSSTCHDKTGICIKCQDFTSGDHCEKCINGYYGNPLLGSQMNCRPCPCPDTLKSGHSFADKCYLNATNNEPICICKEGYSGDRCNKCSENYFGEPNLPNGFCHPCNCSDNWIVNETGNCHPNTGKCLKCLYHTDGWNCQQCKSGYWGNALNRTCSPCECSFIGTNNSRVDKCHRITGKCNCLPNVAGDACDICIKNHWGLALGKGCIPCDCDSVGSIYPKCNEFNGECVCKNGFGGPKCHQCMKNYWGNPQEECKPCNCDPKGSQSFQCDPDTGTCICLEGINGEKCDSCARGFYQDRELTSAEPVYGKQFHSSEIPQCLPCGECYNNWDQILDNLINSTQIYVAEANTKLNEGAEGIYTNVFAEITKNLNKLKKLVFNNTVPLANVSKLELKITDLFDELTNLTKSVQNQQNWFLLIDQKRTMTNTMLEQLQKHVVNQSNYVDIIMNEAIMFVVLHPQGAFNLTKDSLRKSKEAENMVKRTVSDEGPISDARRIVNVVEMRLNGTKSTFLKTQHQNEEILKGISDKILNITQRIPVLNFQICGVNRTKVFGLCQLSLCERGGCSNCDRNFCSNGFMNRAKSGLLKVQNAEKLFEEKKDKATYIIQQIIRPHKIFQDSCNVSLEAFKLVSSLHNVSQSVYLSMKNLTARFNALKFSMDSNPNEIIEIIQECISLKISFSIEEYEAIQREIKLILDTKDFSMVGDIINETRKDKLRCNELNQSASVVHKAAIFAEKFAANSSNAMEMANQAQQSTIGFMNAIHLQSPVFSKRIIKIQSTMNNFAHVSSDTQINVDETYSNVENMFTENVINKQKINSAQMILADIKTKETSVAEQLKHAAVDFDEVSGKIQTKFTETDVFEEVLKDLMRRATNLANRTNYINDVINEIEMENKNDEIMIEEMQRQLLQMNCEMIINLKVMEDKSNFYRICTAYDTWQPDTTCVCRPGTSEPDCVANSLQQIND